MSLSLLNTLWQLDFTSDTCLPGGVPFLLTPPCRGSYDALVLLCNVLHMAAGPGSKLWVEWCFCSTWIIPEERASVHTAASNKVVKMSAEAPRQHTPPGSCCLPGAHLQIIYCGRRCQSVLSGHAGSIQSWVKDSKLLCKELGNNNNFLNSAENIVVFGLKQVEPVLKLTLFCDFHA